MKIGEVSNVLGTEVHVLRHWDDMGVVSPQRTSTGQREYSEENLTRLRIVLACRRVGISLPDIRSILHRSEPGRTAVIERRIQAIRTQRAHLDSSEQFLLHVISCRHDLLTRCVQCTEYAVSEAGH